jgi:hypothetical protein
MPIGFTGGDSRTLVIFLALIAIGLFPRPIPGLSKKPQVAGAWPVVIWLLLPPSILYGYSLVGHPVFGPSRYNVSVAPAYLLLIARGMSRMPWLVHVGSGLALPSWMLIMGVQVALPTEPNAAWRSAAQFLDRRAPGRPVIVISPSAGRNFEVEVARYYLGPDRPILPMPDGGVDAIDGALGFHPKVVYVSASLREGSPVGRIPVVWQRESPFVRHLNFRSIRLIEVLRPDEPD